MKLQLRRDLGGYALDAVIKAGIDGTVLDKPFVLLTGPNGSGKSAILRAIRASIGLRGERAGQLGSEAGSRPIDMAEARGDIERMNTHVTSFRRDGAADYVPAVFVLKDLGWRGQPTYLFESRAASTIAEKSSFGDDIGYHISLIAGGGKNVSHGQFVSRTWWEAIGWAAGLEDVEGGWSNGSSIPARKALLEAALDGGEPSTERWLFIDEPETAIDAEALFLGLSVLLELAEVGRLRVVCASHSLLFAAGLMHHPKIQVLDMGSTWLKTQEIVLGLARDEKKVSAVGTDILARMTARRSASEAPKRGRREATSSSAPARRTSKKASRPSPEEAASIKEAFESEDVSETSDAARIREAFDAIRSADEAGAWSKGKDKP